MENNKHHIDQFLKEQTQQLPVELNEAHWEDAKRRLDEDEKKKRPFLLFFILAILLIGLGTTAYKKLSNNKKSKSVFVRQERSANDPIQKAEAAPAQFINTSTSESVTSSENNDKNSKSKTSNSNPKDKTIQAASYTSAQAITPSTKTKLTENNSPTSSPKAASTKNTGKTNVTKAKVAPNEKPTRRTKKSPSSDLPKKTKAITAKAKTKNNNPTSGQAAASHAETTAISKDIIKSTENAKTAIVSAAPAKPSKKVKIYRSPEDFQKMNPRYVKGLEAYTYTQDAIPMSQKQSDSIRAVVAAQDAPVSKEQKTPKEKQQFVQRPSSFYMLAGLAIAGGFKGEGETKIDYGLSPSIGFGYQYNFNERMSLFFSLYMSYINHLNITETGTKVSYSFDKDSTFISVTRKNLLQLHVPIQYAYKLKPRHTLFGGLGINLGLNSISLYNDSKLSSANRQFGFMDGIRFMDVNATLGYEYSLSPQLSIGAVYQRGFLDMTKNDYFNNQQIDNNTRVGINVRYKFMR